MEDVYWECFFNNAGINGPSSKEYALIFVKNKISKTILKHLEDNHLKSMGIEPVGDIIRILKYIKNFPQLEKIPKTAKEIPDSVSEIPPVVISKEVKAFTTYEKVEGFEVPVPVKRIVTPEIEGRYKINNPNKVNLYQPKNIKSVIPTNSENMTSTLNASNRIVMLSTDNKLDNGQNKKSNNVSILKRLGESLEKYERLNTDEGNKLNQKHITSKPSYEINRKKLNLSGESQKSNSDTKKLPLKNIYEISKPNVFLRLGAQCSEETEKIDKTNNSCITSDDVNVRSGHATDSVRKVEATSTTSTVQYFRNNGNKSQSIKDRLGYR